MQARFHLLTHNYPAFILLCLHICSSQNSFHSRVHSVYNKHYDVPLVYSVIPWIAACCCFQMQPLEGAMQPLSLPRTSANLTMKQEQAARDNGTLKVKKTRQHCFMGKATFI